MQTVFHLGLERIIVITIEKSHRNVVPTNRRQGDLIGVLRSTIAENSAHYDFVFYLTIELTESRFTDLSEKTDVEISLTRR